MFPLANERRPTVRSATAALRDYSVPSEYASRRLMLRRYADRIVLLDPADSRMIADHPRSYGRRQDLLLPEHERDFLVRTRHRRDRHQSR